APLAEADEERGVEGLVLADAESGLLVRPGRLEREARARPELEVLLAPAHERGRRDVAERRLVAPEAQDARARPPAGAPRAADGEPLGVAEVDAPRRPRDGGAGERRPVHPSSTPSIRGQPSAPHSTGARNVSRPRWPCRPRAGRIASSSAQVVPSSTSTKSAW